MSILYKVQNYLSGSNPRFLRINIENSEDNSEIISLIFNEEEAKIFQTRLQENYATYRVGDIAMAVHRDVVFFTYYRKPDCDPNWTVSLSINKAMLQNAFLKMETEGL